MEHVVSHHAAEGNVSPPIHNANRDPDEMQAEIDRLRQREAQIMALIGCTRPEKLIHDLRNLLNEIQLLRAVSNLEKT